MAEEKLMRTQFDELVKPEIYIPSLSAGLLQLKQTTAQIAGSAAEINQLQHVATEIAQTSNVAGVAGLAQRVECVASVAQIAKPWLTDLSAFSAFKTGVPDSNFGRLV